MIVNILMAAVVVGLLMYNPAFGLVAALTAAIIALRVGRRNAERKRREDVLEAARIASLRRIDGAS